MVMATAFFVAHIVVPFTATVIGWEIGREMLYAWTGPSV